MDRNSQIPTKAGYFSRKQSPWSFWSELNVSLVSVCVSFVFVEWVFQLKYLVIIWFGGLCVSYSIRQLQQPLSHLCSWSARVNSCANLTNKPLTPSSRMRGSALIHPSRRPTVRCTLPQRVPPPRVHPAPSSWHNAALPMPLYIPYQSAECLAAITRRPSIRSRGLSASLRSAGHNWRIMGNQMMANHLCVLLFFLQSFNGF